MTSVVDSSADTGATKSGRDGGAPDIATDATEATDPTDAVDLNDATDLSELAPHERRRRRRPLVVAAVLVAGSLALVAAAVVGRASGGDDGSGAGANGADPASRQTTDITVRDLIEQDSVSGTLGYGDVQQVTLPARSSGGDDTGGPPSDNGSGNDTGSNVVTALPPVGTVVERGGTIAEVDGKPVPLLYADRPFWRSLSLGVSDGADVKMLEDNLVALGYATSKNLTVDEAFTEATADAIKRWQDALDREQTGTFDPADAAVQPGAVRISKHLAALGASAAGPLLEVTGATKFVTVDLEADRQDLVSVGLEVDVELPDGKHVAGVVDSIGTVATASSDSGPGGGGDPTVPVKIRFADPSAVGAFDQAPVTINVTTEAAKGVLAVPVDALLALAEGGYALERVGPRGATELVGVELGAFADGWVEVRGSIAEGDKVVVPG